MFDLHKIHLTPLEKGPSAGDPAFSPALSALPSCIPSVLCVPSGDTKFSVEQEFGVGAAPAPAQCDGEGKQRSLVSTNGDKTLVINLCVIRVIAAT